MNAILALVLLTPKPGPPTNWATPTDPLLSPLANPGLILPMHQEVVASKYRRTEFPRRWDPSGN